MRGAARRLEARRRWSRAPSPLPPLSPLTTHIDDVVDDDDDDDDVDDYDDDLTHTVRPTTIHPRATRDHLF